MVTLSVGEALLGVDGDDAEALLAEADRKMYGRKQQKRARRLNREPEPETEAPDSLFNAMLG
jgi:GGDEF domain-containing protein